MSRALIAGCGYVGSALGALLAERGHEVWGIRRDVSALPRAIRPIAASLLEPASLAAHRAPFDWLFFTAGSEGATEAAYRRTYLEALGNVIDVFGRDSGRALFTSSTAVYAPENGERVDELSPAEPTDFSGRVLLEAERLLGARHADAVVLRLGGIYGPGRASLLEAVLSGEARYDPEDPSPVNRFHRDDCAGALAHLAALDRPERLYLGVDDEPASRAEVVAFLAERLGVELPRALGDARRRGKSSKRCSNARLRASGYALAYPTYREGYGALVSSQN